MDTRVRQVTRALQGYNRSMFASRRHDGIIGVYRKAVDWKSFEFDGALYHYSKPSRRLLFVLTDNWTLSGKPVEWGIEPILALAREGDAERDDTEGEKRRQDREKKAELRDRAETNNLKAMAYDMRRDVAKTFDQFNTSTCNKVDPRRKKWA